MKRKKILILGCSSFGGSSMVNFLLNKNQYKVYGTFRRRKNIAYLPYLDNNRVKDFKSYKVDFNKSPKKIINIILSIKPDYIVDFASICMVNQSWQFPQVYFDINVQYKLNIFKNLKKYNFLRKYILVSTPEIFGNSNKLLKEDSRDFNPSTPYATSKLCTELLLKNYANNYSIPIVITRISNFFGPGQPIYRLIPKIITCIDKKINFPLEGDGEAKRNYIFSDDFCNGIYKAMIKGRKGNTYHFSGNEYYKTIDIVKIICKLKFYDYKKLISKQKGRVGQDLIYKLDCKKTRKELKWKPVYNLNKALLEVINYKPKLFRRISKQKLTYTDTNFKNA